MKIVQLRLWNRHALQGTRYLVTEDVVMHVVLLGRLRGQHEGLREAPHGRAAVGQLARHLHYYSVTQRRLRVHLMDNSRFLLLNSEKL